MPHPVRDSHLRDLTYFFTQYYSIEEISCKPEFSGGFGACGQKKKLDFSRKIAKLHKLWWLLARVFISCQAIYWHG